MENNQSGPSISLPGAIIIAGAIIAVAIIWVKKPAAPAPALQQPSLNQPAELNIREITVNDHVLGNPNAPVKIIEYSDPSCPFCKVFNATMTKIMDEYGPVGKVAWVYRHFPLDKPNENGYVLHKNAGNESQALECAAVVGGNTLFWAFEKNLYAKTPGVSSASPDGLDQSTLPTLAKEVGIDPKAFSDCLSSGRTKDKVNSDYLEGVNSGVTGTPFSVIITPSGSKIPLTGARSYQDVKNAIEALLAESEYE